MDLELNFYGVNVRVNCKNPNVIDCLKREFKYFLSETGISSVEFYLEALEQSPPYHLIPEGTEASIITMYSSSYRNGNYVYTDYQGRGFLIYDLVGGRGEAYSDDEIFLTTIVRALIISKVVELLSVKGIYSFPWFGVSINRLVVLFLMFHGGGKSILALELLKNSELMLVGDTHTLVSRNGEILPFHRNIDARGGMLSWIPQNRQKLYINVIYEPRVSIDINYFSDKLSGPCRPYIMAVCKRIFSEKPPLRSSRN